MPAENFANQPQTTVSSGGTTAPASGTTETWTVASSSGFPAANSGATPPTQFHVADTASGLGTELIAVTNVSGSTWTVTRGAEGTATVAHTSGFTIVQVVSAGAFSGFLQSANNLADVASAPAARTSLGLGSAATVNTPVPVTSGGTGQASFTAYGVLAAGTTPTGAVQQVPGTGSSGQVLTSNGASALPSWQAPGASLPLTTLGDTLYENGTPAPARLPGNTSSTKNFLTQTGNGTVSAAPAWGTIAAADLPAATTSTQGAVILDGTAADIQPDGPAAAGTKGQAADAKHVHPLQPWQFQPESYNPKAGDGITCTVTTVASSTTITAATAVFTSTAADGGKYIMIHGAQGASAGPLITTISSVTDSTHAVLAAAPAASVAGCPAVFGTDCAAALASAASAAGAYATANDYYAEVVLGPKIYVLHGLTQTGNGSTTPTFNTQVPLPYPAANGTSQKLVIALTGAGDAGYCQYWGSLIPNLAGTCLVSMLTTGTSPDPTFGQQSVIGGPSGAAGFTSIGGNQAFANVKAVIRGISVWLPIWTNIYAFDLGYVTACRVQQSSAHIFAPTGVNSAAVLPYLSNIGAGAFLSSVGTGLRTPVNQNNDDMVLDDVTVEGYECAYRIFDHLHAGRLAAIYSDVAVFLNPGGGIGHLISIANMSAEAYNGGLLTNGTSPQTCQVDIAWSAECGSVSYDVNDPSNYLSGVFRFQDPADLSRGITVTGAGHLKIINDNLGPGYWSGAPAAPASTVAQQNTAWRDAWITLSATSGITVITVDGQTTGLTAGNGVAVQIRVPSGKSYAVTYAGTLTAKWWLD